MSHQQQQSEIDYEKQFQDDLAKATALSLEQQALDEYRRNKKYGRYERAHSAMSSVPSDVATNATNYYAQVRERYGQTSEVSSTSGTGIGSSHPRRHSEVSSFPAAITVATSNHGRLSIDNTTNNIASVTLPRSQTPPAMSSTPENDLISFASPTSKQPETPGGTSNSFEQLIEDLHKLQATNRTALVPLGPTAAAPNAPMHHTVYRSAPPTALYVNSVGPPQYTNVGATSSQPLAGAAGMQLVPFTPSVSQKVPLTNDELQKLYSMPHPQSALQHQMGFYMPYPAGQYATQSAPTTANPGVYTAPKFTPYGFKYSATMPSTPGASYYQPQVPASAAATPVNVGGVSTATSTRPHSTKSIGNNSNASISNGGGANSSASITGSMLRRQTPPARRGRNPGDDLIDLSQEEDSRVSVLEAFDPLLNEDSIGSRCVKYPKQ